MTNMVQDNTLQLDEITESKITIRIDKDGSDVNVIVSNPKIMTTELAIEIALSYAADALPEFYKSMYQAMVNLKQRQIDLVCAVGKRKLQHHEVAENLAKCLSTIVPMVEGSKDLVNVGVIASINHLTDEGETIPVTSMAVNDYDDPYGIILDIITHDKRLLDKVKEYISETEL